MKSRLERKLTKANQQRRAFRRALEDIARRGCNYPNLPCRTWSSPLSMCPPCQARTALQKRGRAPNNPECRDVAH